MLMFFFTTFLLSVFLYSMVLKHIHFFLQQFQKKQIQIMANIQLPANNRMTDLISVKFIELSARTKFIVLSSSGSLSVIDLLRQLCQLPIARRKLVLLDSLREIQFVYLFILLFLLGKINPWLLLCISLLSFFIFKKDSVKQFMQILIFSSLFLLVTHEYGLKFFHSVQMFFVENPSFMFISSNGITAMLFCLLFAFVIGLFIQVDFWSAILGYLLVLTGIISVSSALALLAGELLARVLHHTLLRKKYKCNYYESIRPRKGFIKILNYPWVAHLVAIICGLFISVDFSALNPLEIEITAMSQMKTTLFLISSIVFMMIYWLLNMIYGHFAASDAE